MRVLVLGGTADGRKLAEKLHRRGVQVVYSVAGFVRAPNVQCEVVSGGFSQFGGLIEYIKIRAISALLDVTHPYAQVMSIKAVEAAKHCDIPCWRFHRPAWQQQEGDVWQEFANWQELLPALRHKQSVFFTAGQIPEEVLCELQRMTSSTRGNDSGQRQLMRTAVKPASNLPATMQWIKATGPFNEKDEQSVMDEHGVDALVSKNSGGESTVAKLNVARKLGIPVFMLKRPDPIASDKVFYVLEQCEQYVFEQCNAASGFA